MQWKGDITAMGEKDAHLKRTLCWWWWRCSLALVKWSHRRPQASTHIFEYLAAAGRRRSSVRFKVAVREIRMKLLVHFSSTGASSFQQSLWWWLNKSSGNKREQWRCTKVEQASELVISRPVWVKRPAERRRRLERVDQQLTENGAPASKHTHYYQHYHRQKSIPRAKKLTGLLKRPGKTFDVSQGKGTALLCHLLFKSWMIDSSHRQLLVLLEIVVSWSALIPQ